MFSEAIRPSMIAWNNSSRVNNSTSDSSKSPEHGSLTLQAFRAENKWALPQP